MDITYKRNGLKNYVVIRNDRPGEPGLHEKMITRNHITNLAPMTPQTIDGTAYYYYDIQGKVSLKTLFTARSLKKEEIKSILTGLREMLGELQRYMLSCEEVIFDPENIWLKADTLTPSFIYVPDLTPDDRYGIKTLAEFLTEHVDGNDREAAGMAFDYLELVENGYILPEMDKAAPGIQTDEGDPDIHTPERVPAIDPSEYWDLKEGISKEMKPYFEDNSKARGIRDKAKAAYICLGGAILVAAVYIVLVLQPSLFPVMLTDEEYMMGGVIIAVLFAIALIAVMIIFNRRTHEIPVKDEQKEPVPDPDSPYDTPAYDNFRRDDELEYMEQSMRQSGQDDDKTVLLKSPKFFDPKSAMPVLCYKDGRHIVIKSLPFLMGKMKSRVDEVIEGEGISRIHAMIKEQDGHYYISDLNSLNGTGVNGRLLDANQTAEIADGDIISLADTDLIFQT